MNKFLKLNKQEQGYSLAGVLIIFIVATVLGMSIVALSVNSMNISNKEHDDQSAYYIAESGTTYKVTQIETLIDSASTETENFITNEVDDPTGAHYSKSEEEIEKIVIEYFFDTLEGYADFDQTINYIDFKEIKGYPPEAEITLESAEVYSGHDNPRTYNILSEGEIDGESRTVQLPIEIKWNKKPEYALLTEKFIKAGTGGVSNPFAIEGDIGVLDDTAGSISFINGSNQALSGTIFVPDGDPDIVDPKPNTGNSIEPLEESTELPKLPDFPEKADPMYPNHDADLIGMANDGNEWVIPVVNNQSYDSITMINGNVLVFDVGDQDYDIHVKDLNLTGPVIKINGTGTINLYVEETFKLAGGSIGEPDKVKQLNIYFAGDHDINLGDGGNSTVYGSIHAKKANLKFAAGSGFYGNILTGGTQIDFEGGTLGEAQLILAPNAYINHDNGVIKGIIVAKEYELDSGNLIFEQVDMSGPLSLEEIMAHSNNDGNTFMQRPDPTIERESVREK